MILDSTFLFDLMSHDRDAFQKGVELVERGEMQWIPAPVLAEAYYGAATERSDVTHEELTNSLLGYPQIDTDERIARNAGELLAVADDASGGQSGVSWNDALIGATADVMDDAVLTRNVDDFETLGVDVETY